MFSPLPPALTQMKTYTLFFKAFPLPPSPPCRQPRVPFIVVCCCRFLQHLHHMLTMLIFKIISENGNNTFDDKYIVVKKFASSNPSASSLGGGRPTKPLLLPFSRVPTSFSRPFHPDKNLKRRKREREREEEEKRNRNPPCEKGKGEKFHLAHFASLPAFPRIKSQYRKKKKKSPRSRFISAFQVGNAGGSASG